MEYYLLKKSSYLTSYLTLGGLNYLEYTAAMTHADFKNLEKLKVAYVKYEKNMVMPDILTYPTFMISDDIRKVFKMYDEAISFKAVQIYPDVEEKIKEVTKTYWIYDCVMEDCLHKDTVISPNGEISDVVLDKSKVKGRDIFRIKGTVVNKTLVSLAVAESLYRRNPYGLELKRVTVR